MCQTVMDKIREIYVQFSNEMIISLALDASVNWLEKLKRYSWLQECYQYFQETLQAMSVVWFQVAGF